MQNHDNEKVAPTTHDHSEEKAIPFFARQPKSGGLVVRTSIRAGAGRVEELKK